MFIKRILLFSLACLAEFPASDAGLWCHTTVPVTKIRTVNRTALRKRYDFWGKLKSGMEKYQYETTESYLVNEMKKDCCKGYSLTLGECMPICTSACPANSVCSAPDTCDCKGLYRRTTPTTHADQLQCRPVCFKDCPLHSHCAAPLQCACDAGYQPKDEAKTQSMSGSAALTSIHECLPVCRQGCHSNGYCSAPDVCSCNEGYEFESQLLGPEANANNHNRTEICVLSRSTTEDFTTEDSTTLYSTDASTYTTEDSTSESAINMTDSTIDGSPSVDTAIDYSTNSLTNPAHAVQYTVRRDTLSPGHSWDSDYRCRIEFDDFGALSTAKCQHVCVDAFGAPCLDLRHCQCNASTLVLTCNSSEENAEESVKDVKTSSYMCHVRSMPATSNTNAPSMKLEADKSENAHTQTSLLILCCILGAGIAALMLYVVWRHMASGRTEGELIVNYHASEKAELTLNS